MAKDKDLTGKPTQDGLDASGAQKLDTTNEVQAPVTDDAHLVKPQVTMEPMTTDVTIPVMRIQHQPGYMSIVSTTAGDLIIPGVAYANEQLPPELAPDVTQDASEGTVTVKASYARSQGLI